MKRRYTLIWVRFGAWRGHETDWFEVQGVYPDFGDDGGNVGVYNHVACVYGEMPLSAVTDVMWEKHYAD